MSNQKDPKDFLCDGERLDDLQRENGSELSAWEFEADAGFYVWFETRFQELVK